MSEAVCASTAGISSPRFTPIVTRVTVYDLPLCPNTGKLPTIRAQTDPTQNTEPVGQWNGRPLRDIPLGLAG